MLSSSTPKHSRSFIDLGVGWEVVTSVKALPWVPRSPPSHIRPDSSEARATGLIKKAAAVVPVGSLQCGRWPRDASRVSVVWEGAESCCLHQSAQICHYCIRKGDAVNMSSSEQYSNYFLEHCFTQCPF